MQDRSHHELRCSLCQGEFDITMEGGIEGYLGMLPIAMCPMCFDGMDMFFEELHGCGPLDDDEDIYDAQ